MNKSLENILMSRIKNNKLTPRDAIQSMVNDGLINNHKKAHATLKKWTKQNIYDYGVCLDLGWFI